MRALSRIGDHTLTANDAAEGDHLSCSCGGWTGTTAVQWLVHVEGPRRQDGTPPPLSQQSIELRRRLIRKQSIRQIITRRFR